MFALGIYLWVECRKAVGLALACSKQGIEKLKAKVKVNVKDTECYEVAKMMSIYNVFRMRKAPSRQISQEFALPQLSNGIR